MEIAHPDPLLIASLVLRRCSGDCRLLVQPMAIDGGFLRGLSPDLRFIAETSYA